MVIGYRIKVIFLLLTFHYIIYGQNFTANSHIPQDTSLRVGKLKNGITYFIKRSSRPQGRVEIHLVLNAGSAQEESDQSGMAHFIEHMSFKSSAHFPNNSMFSKLHNYGIKRDDDFNASTSTDETDFYVIAPVHNDSAVVNSFKAIADRINGLAFDSLEVEQVKRVVLQEWGQRAQQYDAQTLGFIIDDINFARDPVGDSSVIRTFTPSRLKRFYTDWYRPELMAVIIVGDFNVKEYEAKVKKYFDFKVDGKSNKKKQLAAIQGEDSTKIWVTRRNYTGGLVQVLYKRKFVPDTTIANFSQSLKNQLLASIVTERLKNISQSEAHPFFDPLSLNNKNWHYPFLSITGFQFSTLGQATLLSLEEYLLAIETLKKFSVSKSELERAKTKLINNYANRIELDAHEEAVNIMAGYLYQKPLFRASWAYNIAKAYLPAITCDEIKKCSEHMLSDSNRVIIIYRKGQESFLTDPYYRLLSDVKRRTLIAPEEEKKDAFFVKPPQITGKIVKEEIEEDLGITVLTLSNNVKVYLKPTLFKKDEIQFKCSRKGGQSLYFGKDILYAQLASMLVYESGYNFSSINELQKSISDKNLSLTPYINLSESGINGKTIPRDQETFFQLLHLMFTSPRIDNSIASLKVKEEKEKVINVYNNPQFYFNDQKERIIACNNPWTKWGDVYDFDRVNFSRCLDIYKEQFFNASGYSFLFSGAFNVDSIKPLIIKWISSLPFVDSGLNVTGKIPIEHPKGIIYRVLRRGDDDKMEVNTYFFKKVPYNNEESQKLDVFREIFRNLLVNVLREKMGEVYSVNAFASLSKVPCEESMCGFSFSCDKTKANILTKEAFRLIDQLKTVDVDRLVLDGVKTQMLNQLEEQKQNNQYWIRGLNFHAVLLDEKLKNFISEDQRSIESVSVEEIKELANKYLSGDNIRIDCLPELQRWKGLP